MNDDECYHHSCERPATRFWVTVNRNRVDSWYFCESCVDSFIGKVCRTGDEVVDFGSEDELEIWLVMYS